MRKATWMAMVVAGVLGAPVLTAYADDKPSERKAEQLEQQADRVRERADERADRFEDRGRDKKAKQVRDHAERKADRMEERADRVEDSADRKANGAGTELSDSWVTTKVKASFWGEDALEGSDISVDTNSKGVVTLTGVVPSEAARARAMELARKVDGVREVKDAMKLRKTR